MKIPVVRSFTDRVTGKPHNKGSVYESDDAQRVKELQAGGFIRPSRVAPFRKDTPTSGPEPAGASEKTGGAETDPEASTAVKPDPVAPPVAGPGPVAAAAAKPAGAQRAGQAPH